MASDFNERLRERGVPKEVTVQGICRACRDERKVREKLKRVDVIIHISSFMRGGNVETKI